MAFIMLKTTNIEKYGDSETIKRGLTQKNKIYKDTDPREFSYYEKMIV